MSEYLIQGGTLEAIANAIRTKKGTTNTMTPAQMSDEIAGITTVQKLSWQQCPYAVRNYLAAAAAVYPSDENVTVIDQFAPSRGHEVVADTKPVGYTIDGVTFRDNVPFVATPFATENKAGTLTALDALRWINTTPTTSADGSVYPRGVNCRDLGGWACDGGNVRYGLLVRGGEPNPADRELMVDRIGVKTEVQLLPVSEQATDYKMKSPWGIDWAGNDTDETFYGLDKPYLWKKVLDAIMDSVLHSKPVYFHCGIGADRTGVVAMCLEAILGVSRADVDMDFELTNFAFGWQNLSGGIYRSRVYSTYKSLMTAVNAVPLANGLTDSFRNRWVSFVLSCGISIEKINAFRVACIDGTPDVITVIMPTYTVTKNGNNVTFDNQIAEVQEYQPYSVGVTANSGYVISDVSVTMGGVDITSQVFSGTPTVRRVSVTNNLTHCITSNNANAAEAGSAYTATITADDGYTLDGATITITMGGTNVNQYYSNGTINIPAVTGDVVISVSAVESVRENLFDISAAHLNARIANVGDLRTGVNGRMICNMIDITNLSTLEIEGVTQVADPDNCYVRLGLYTNSTLAQASFVTAKNLKNATYTIDVAALKSANPTATHIAIQMCLGTAEISAADVADLAIYGE